MKINTLRKKVSKIADDIDSLVRQIKRFRR